MAEAHTDIDPALGARIAAAATEARQRLLRHMTAAGHWDGKLAPSALATAVATFALAQTAPSLHRDLVFRGLSWLAHNANPDGGWGDTPRSASNVSATVLCWSVLNCAERIGVNCDAAVAGAERWLCSAVGGLEPARIAQHVIKYYGDDRTFSAPILTMCALAARLGSSHDAWRLVPQLPFELAVLPHRFFHVLRLGVVSYAMPALIAVGYVRHRHTHHQFPLRKLMRNFAAHRTLALLDSLQPDRGGFLEAVPLTGFVVMSLAASGRRNSAVIERGVRFLRGTIRPDGSWPIDSNLATWLTTLSVDALCADPRALDDIPVDEQAGMRDWLLDQQTIADHPFTHAAAGGWAWTDLAGGVPDADDTAGAVLALAHLGVESERARAAALNGIGWLLDLQNRDGGMPTFCRGWGRLPFDRSSPDVTAHALRAFSTIRTWRSASDSELRSRIDTAILRAIRFLSRSQRADGAWIPLWFGNEQADRRENPVYGTAQVVRALAALGHDPATSMFQRAIAWLRSAQQPDGGWGGAPGVQPSIEETSLAVSALASVGADQADVVTRGAAWLAGKLNAHEQLPATPIGLYFATLWYYEELYPLIFATAALSQAQQLLSGSVPN